MHLPEIFKTEGLIFDPEKVTAYHEAGGHALVMVAEGGLLPEFTSLEPLNTNSAGFVSNEYVLGADYGFNWQRHGPIFNLKWRYAGIIAGAWYSGAYNWDGAREDKTAWEGVITLFKINYRIQLLAWIQVHEFLEANGDLMVMAAEKLFIDRVIDANWWEENVLLTQ